MPVISNRIKIKVFYWLLLCYALLLPLIEYYYYETWGATGVVFVAAAALLGLLPGILAALYASGVFLAIYFLGGGVGGAVRTEVILGELFTYAVISVVIGLVVNRYNLNWNNMAENLTELQKAKEALNESQQRMVNIFNFLPDPTFAISSSGKVIAWNKAIAELTGIKAEKMVGKDNFEHSYALFGERKPFLTDIVIEKALNPETDIIAKYPLVRLGEDNTIYGDTFCYRNRKKRGYLWTKASPLHSSKGYLVGAIASLRDVTDRKKAEEKLKYLSYHDLLTGLYNRAYFEEEIKRLNNDRRLPLSIIMSDVNGLKQINDNLGHHQGDKLLVAAAQCIKSCCRREDIICRWGGDEFSIILPKTDYETSMQICRRIKETCTENNPAGAVPLSLSLGAATKVSPGEEIFAVIKTAEDLMYLNKAAESTHNRGGIVSSLQKLLEEKTEETVEHASRINKYALLVGQALRLSTSELHELSLLAALHDLGKIAIPDSIILKLDKLSNEEWTIMQKHTEIGYNISSSIPELAHISRKILHHHEWWNGLGYPAGLSGEEIPLLSRIIAIIDAYDVMTSGRSYKQPLSREKALLELEKYSGTHFDPVLVKTFVEILKSATILPNNRPFANSATEV